MSEPAYDATYALSQLLRTQQGAGTKTKAVDATYALSAMYTAAPTQGVPAPSLARTTATAAPAVPTHTFRVEKPEPVKKEKR